MIKDCSTRYGNIYSLFTRGNDPDIIAVENHLEAIFLIDTESTLSLCQMIHPEEINFSELIPICATKVDEKYLNSLVLAEELLIDESPMFKA